MKRRVLLIFLIASASIALALLLYARFYRVSIPQPEEVVKQNPPGEYRTINVYTGNVVSPGEQKDDSANNHKKNPGRVYPITDGKTYRILPIRKYVCEDTYWADSHHAESLELNLGGKWKEVYRTEDKGDGHCWQSLNIDDRNIVLSPLKDYVRFFLAGWEWGDTLLVNINTGKNVFEKETNPGAIIWSKDGRSYAFVSNQEVFGGTGRDGVWVSSYRNPEKPVFIFDGVGEMSISKDEAFWQLYMIDDLKFVDNRTIEFLIYQADQSDNSKHFGEIARYRYDLKIGKLTEISKEK